MVLYHHKRRQGEDEKQHHHHQCRADGGEEFCEVCVREANRTHHYTCPKGSEYCSAKEQYELDLIRRLKYQNRRPN